MAITNFSCRCLQTSSFSVLRKNNSNSTKELKDFFFKFLFAISGNSQKMKITPSRTAQVTSKCVSLTTSRIIGACIEMADLFAVVFDPNNA